MPRQRKRRPTHIHLNTLTWECEEHGPHRVIVAGLDDSADLAAKIISAHPTRDGSRPTLRSERFPVDEASAASLGFDHDDLPY